MLRTLVAVAGVATAVAQWNDTVWTTSGYVLGVQSGDVRQSGVPHVHVWCKHTRVDKKMVLTVPCGGRELHGRRVALNVIVIPCSIRQVMLWNSIPYAAPPVGDLRFKVHSK